MWFFNTFRFCIVSWQPFAPGDRGRWAIVKINDRGPFAKGRMVDLSSSVFRRIAKLDAGVIDVKIEVIK